LNGDVDIGAFEAMTPSIGTMNGQAYLSTADSILNGTGATANAYVYMNLGGTRYSAQAMHV